MRRERVSPGGRAEHRLVSEQQKTAKVYAEMLLTAAERTYEAGCLRAHAIAHQALLALTSGNASSPVSADDSPPPLALLGAVQTAALHADCSCGARCGTCLPA
jgi:hypothetical protein